MQASNTETDWDDISGAFVAIDNNSGSKLFNMPDVLYKFYRVVVTVNTGTLSTLRAESYTKGF